MTAGSAGIHLGATPATSNSSNDLHNQFGPLARSQSPAVGTVKVDNPMPHLLPEGENAAPLEVIGTTASDKLVIIMVGLPATGKTHIAKRICRFLSFFQLSTGKIEFVALKSCLKLYCIRRVLSCFMCIEYVTKTTSKRL